MQIIAVLRTGQDRNKSTNGLPWCIFLTYEQHSCIYHNATRQSVCLRYQQSDGHSLLFIIDTITTDPSTTCASHSRRRWVPSVGGVRGRRGTGYGITAPLSFLWKNDATLSCFRRLMPRTEQTGQWEPRRRLFARWERGQGRNKDKEGTRTRQEQGQGSRKVRCLLQDGD